MIELGVLTVKNRNSIQLSKRKLVKFLELIDVSEYRSIQLISILGELLNEVHRPGSPTALGVALSPDLAQLKFSILVNEHQTSVHQKLSDFQSPFDWDHTFEKHEKNGKLYLKLILSNVFIPFDPGEIEIENLKSILSELTVEESLSKDLENSFVKLKEKSRALIESKKNAELASNAKSSFLANMSHEIRTPLGAIMGFADLLNDDDLSGSKKKDYINTINRNANQLKFLIDDILDLSKIESGMMSIEKQKFSLFNLLLDVKETMAVQAAGSGIGLLAISEGLFPEFIQSDSTRIRQVLINLVGNALKFTDRGSVELSVKCSDFNLATKSALLEFTVKDTGIGMSAESVSKLFQPFTQADDSTARRFGGTGLGLTLSKNLSQALGGDLKLMDSVLGEGSTFKASFRVGADEDSLVELHENSKFRHLDETKFFQEKPLSDLKILVVDDVFENLILAKTYLERNGAESVIVSSGLKALNLVKENRYDAILMDIQMPVIDGYETITRIREMDVWTPIIALSANALKEEKERALGCGCNTYITKPFKEKVLVESIISFM